VASIEITNDALIVHVEGLDRLWALRSRLEIPLQHVLGAEVDPERATNWWQGVRIMGTALPGVIRARFSSTVSGCFGMSTTPR
jgi:hypothetical protein